MKQTLSYLEKENRKLEQEISELNKIISLNSQIISEKQKKIRKNREAIKNMSREFTISDHALLRYIERKTGVSIDDLKEELLPPPVKDLLKKASDMKLTHNGIQYVVKDYTLVTII